MIFLNFILSPIGRWLLVLVLAGALGASAYVKGRMDCAEISQAVALKTQVTTLQAQIDAINSLLENARAREAAAQDEAAKLNDKVSSYEEQLSNIPTPKSCGLTRNDIDRLRNIATGSAR